MALDIMLANANNSFRLLARRQTVTEVLVELCVDGVDLDSEADLVAIGEHLSDWSWTAIDEQVVVSLTATGNPVDEVRGVVAALKRVLPNACVTRWYEDLVGYSEIAQRAGVTREAVRLWATGQRGSQDFPVAHGAVGAGDRRSPVWPWSVVAAWLSENDVYVDPYVYPAQRQVAEINWVLAQQLDREVVGA